LTKAGQLLGFEPHPNWVGHVEILS
jgi:hypothetical protein